MFTFLLSVSYVYKIIYLFVISAFSLFSVLWSACANIIFFSFMPLLNGINEDVCIVCRILLIMSNKNYHGALIFFPTPKATYVHFLTFN